MLTSYSVLRTGTLWFAVGLHCTFNTMQFFVIGGRHTERISVECYGASLAMAKPM